MPFYHQTAKGLQKGEDRQEERLMIKRGLGRKSLGAEMKVDNKEREWCGITEVYKVNGHICDLILFGLCIL